MTHLSIIAGLGNPEDKYEQTLHNAGFWYVDALARKYAAEFRYEKKFDADCCRVNIGGAEIWLVKPQSYMNLSGGPIRAVMDYYRLKPAQLLVAHDEIDLPPGTVRLKQGGGHGGHNGIRDVIRHCGADFMRLRFGIGRPPEYMDTADYVLQRFSRDENQELPNQIDDAAKAIETALNEGVDSAMNWVNR